MILNCSIITITRNPCVQWLSTEAATDRVRQATFSLQNVRNLGLALGRSPATQKHSLVLWHLHFQRQSKVKMVIDNCTGLVKHGMDQFPDFL